MRQYRVIFYFLFFLFHVSLFTFSIYVESHKDDFNYLLKLQGYIQYMKYGTFFGLILVTVDYFMDKVELGKLYKQIEQLTNETNAWKAKLYDQQEGKTAAQTEQQVPEGRGEPSGNSD